MKFKMVFAGRFGEILNCFLGRIKFYQPPTPDQKVFRVTIENEIVLFLMKGTSPPSPLGGAATASSVIWLLTAGCLDSNSSKTVADISSPWPPEGSP